MKLLKVAISVISVELTVNCSRIVTALPSTKLVYFALYLHACNAMRLSKGGKSGGTYLFQLGSKCEHLLCNKISVHVRVSPFFFRNFGFSMRFQQAATVSAIVFSRYTDTTAVCSAASTPKIIMEIFVVP